MLFARFFRDRKGRVAPSSRSGFSVTIGATAKVNASFLGI